MRLLQLACSCSSDQRPALACCRNLSCFRWHNAFASLCCGAGTWAGHELSVEGGSVVVETADREVRIPYTQAKTPAELDYNSLGVQQVWECTGVFLTRKALQPYFDKGVPKVVVSAPVKDAEDPVLNIVYGVNHQAYNPKKDHIVTAASCTTNCLAPVVKVIQEKLGIQHGCITTIHNLTNTQTIVDAPNTKKSDLRRAR
eukprot:GHUV01044231.1.p1 GENE.GHUV01044231.1~~GHUV01044231.1.p1  ORF type:complete len:200 (-),score=45.91 GHUV01044231.1:448-1047(-)